MDSLRAVWWTGSEMDVVKMDRLSTFIACTYDGIYEPRITLSFDVIEGDAQKGLADGQREFQIDFDLCRNRENNRLAAYSVSFNQAVLTLVVKKTTYRSAGTVPHYTRQVAELLENEWKWSGVAVLRLILTSPSFVRAFEEFVARHSPPGLEVMEAAILQYISSFHSKMQMGDGDCFGRFEGTVNFITQIFETLMVQRICPGCAAPFEGDCELVQHFDWSEECHVKCSCGSNPGTETAISSHVRARHGLICPSCEWVGDWLGLQEHLQTSTRCAFALEDKWIVGPGHGLAPQAASVEWIASHVRPSAGTGPPQEEAFAANTHATPGGS